MFDHSNEGFKGWEFMTVHCWGERAAGEWTLEIHDTPSQVRNPAVQGKGPPAPTAPQRAPVPFTPKALCRQLSLAVTFSASFTVFSKTVLPKFF